MKFYRTDFTENNHYQIEFSENYRYNPSFIVDNISGLRDLKNTVVFGKIFYDLLINQISTDIKIKGDMIVGCAISNDDVIVPFETNFNQMYSFKPTDDEEIIEIKTDVIDLTEDIFKAILFEVPIKVVKPGLKEYPKGDGWEVMKEEDFDNREKPIDPRLAKLKEFNVK